MFCSFSIMLFMHINVHFSISVTSLNILSMVAFCLGSIFPGMGIPVVHRSGPLPSDY